MLIFIRGANLNYEVYFLTATLPPPFINNNLSIDASCLIHAYLDCFLNASIAEGISIEGVSLDHSSQKSTVALRGFRLGCVTFILLGRRLASPTTRASQIGRAHV